MAVNQIIDIEAPLLSSTDYGRDVEQMVQNINYNFEVLANQAFVKRAPGDNTVVEKVVLHSGTDEWNQVIAALNLSSDDKTINGVNSWSLMNNTSIYFICEQDLTDPDNPVLTRISSLPYYFIDARFVSNNMSLYPEEYVSNPTAGAHQLVVNRSCVLVWNGSSFDRIVGAFPMLNYVGNKFVWNVNGFNTGLPASGVQGAQGTPGLSLIVKFITKDREGPYQAIEYMDVSSFDIMWREIDADIIKSINEKGINCSVFAIEYDRNDDPTGNIYFSPMFVYEDMAYIYCSKSNQLDLTFNERELINILNSISPVSVIKGLYVPTGHANNAHMFYDTIGELNISPVVDHDNILAGTLRNKILNIDYDTVNLRDVSIRDLNSLASNTLGGTNTISGTTSITGSTTIGGNITVSAGTSLNFEDGRYMENIAYADLVRLRDGNNLVPGRQYHITDYTATTVQANTISAGNVFDIIATAIDDHTLSEQCSAINHGENSGGLATADYFENCKLSAWKIWYCLDNDTSRFAWADTSSNGRGVIYRMIDEFGNDCPYDFKNIKFLVSGSRYTYTFGLYTGSDVDISVYQYIAGDAYPNCCYGNVIKPYFHYPNINEYDGYPSSMRELNYIYFYVNILNNPALIRIYCNTFEENCHNIKLEMANVDYKFMQNQFGSGCHDIISRFSGESGYVYHFFDNCVFYPDAQGLPLRKEYFNYTGSRQLSRIWGVYNGANLIYIDPAKLTLNESDE